MLLQKVSFAPHPSPSNKYAFHTNVLYWSICGLTWLVVYYEMFWESSITELCYQVVCVQYLCHMISINSFRKP